jgi:nitrite reductase/ring-hydroxylating ferredoxin subunit
MSELNRRQFVAFAASAAACACCATCGIAGAAEKPGSAPASAAMAKTPVDVGPKTDFATDGITDKFAKSHRVLIVRHEGKIYAPTATCTHKNSALKLKDGELVCPSHGSKYSVQGTPTKGPAKGSLFRYGISVDDKGHIIVNRAKQFAEKQWDDEGASITA